jgi:hypothetical protein
MSDQSSGGSGNSGAAAVVTQAVSTVSAAPTTIAQTTAPPSKPTQGVVTQSLVPVVEPTTAAPQEPVNTPTASPNETPQNESPPPPQRSRAGSSTIIPTISIGPITTSSIASKPKAPPTVISVEPPPEPTTLQTIFLTTTAPPPPPKSSSETISKSGSSVQPSLLGNATPVGDPKDQSSQANKGKSAGATVAGVIGGLSAAILLGILLFFLWKWKSRGRYGSNKRQSFGPYGNGIDANRAGLLVSSVPYKSSDNSSTDAHPTCKSN